MEVSSSEFRNNMGEYFDSLNRGGEIIIKSRSKGSFRIIAIKDKEEEFADTVRGAMKEYKSYLKGEHTMKTEEEFWNEFYKD